MSRDEITCKITYYNSKVVSKNSVDYSKLPASVAGIDDLMW
jgi:hypothetical protein